MGKFLLNIFFAVGLILLGSTVLQYGINTFAPYFNLTIMLTYSESILLYILSGLGLNLVTGKMFISLQQRLKNLGSETVENYEEMLETNLGTVLAMLVIWLELWILNLIVF